MRALLLLLAPTACALDNGAALTPPLGWQNWNGFGMRFNASLFRSMAAAMKENGLLAAGYDLLSAGGSTYPHQGLAPHWNSTNASNIVNLIVRNASGYYQIDPARFPGPGSSADCLDEAKLRACLANHSKSPGSPNAWPSGNPEGCGCVNGNEGMAALSAELRAQGFRWGSYSNEAGCKVAACDTPALNASKYRGFIDQDAELMLDYWHSDYVMVDSVGNEPPYDKSDQRWWSWPKALLTEWSAKVKAYSRPVILHSCHNRCGSTFSGPTLLGATCNASDRSQQWTVPSNAGAPGVLSGYLRDAGEGLCVGCGDYFGNPCANDALSFKNGSGHGAGMQSCGGVCPYCSKTQQYNYSVENKTLVRTDGSCLELLGGSARQVVAQRAQLCNTSAAQQWAPADAGAARTGAYTQLRSVGSPGLCLSSSAAHVNYPLDPWCKSNNNMWRSSTDTLQVWSRVMTQVESLVGLGTVSGPGQWGFGDCLELGVPGGGILTWEESKSHLALYAVTSQPLFLGNDVRPGYMQQRLLDILLNKDMLAVNQQYHGFAGDRMWTAAVGREVWAKPLPGGRAGVVLFNRNGTTSSCDVIDSPYSGSLKVPCDDNATESSGAQTLSLAFDVLPSQWLLDDEQGGPPQRAHEAGAISCEVRDIFSGATGKASKDLGRHSGAFTAEDVPPHGCRFLMLSNCTAAHHKIEEEAEGTE